MRLLVIAVIACLIFGVQGTITGVKNLEITKLSFQEFENKGTDKDWLSVSECRLDIMNSAYREKDGQEFGELFIPVRGFSDSTNEGAVSLIFKTEDAELIGALNKLATAESEESVQQIIFENASIFIAPRKIEGLKTSFLDLDSDELSSIKSVIGNVTSDAIIINDGKKPNLILSLILLLIGIGIPAMALVNGNKNKTPEFVPAQ